MKKQKLKTRNIEAEEPQASPGQFDAVLEYLRWYKSLAPEVVAKLDTPRSRKAKEVLNA